MSSPDLRRPLQICRRRFARNLALRKYRESTAQKRNSVYDAAPDEIADFHTVGGICKVFRYSFDGSGDLIGQTDTGETAPYAR